MATYLLAYIGGEQPESDEAMQQDMQEWMGWFDRLGDAVADPGNPTGASAAVAPDGSVTAAASGISGYTVVTADSLDDAVEIAKGCPHLAANGTIEVYETFDPM